MLISFGLFSNFEKLRIDKHNNWFEGASGYAASTNCAIESFKEIFKRFYFDLVVSPSKLVDSKYKYHTFYFYDKNCNSSHYI